MISRSDLWGMLDALAAAGFLASLAVILYAGWRDRRQAKRSPPPETEPMQCCGGPRDGFTSTVSVRTQTFDFPVLLEEPRIRSLGPGDAFPTELPKIGRLRYVRWGRRADGVALFRPER